MSSDTFLSPREAGGRSKNVQLTRSIEQEEAAEELGDGAAINVV